MGGDAEFCEQADSLACNTSWSRTNIYMYICTHTHVCIYSPVFPWRGEVERDIVGGFCDLRDDCHVCRERTLARDSLPCSRDTLLPSLLQFVPLCSRPLAPSRQLTLHACNIVTLPCNPPALLRSFRLRAHVKLQPPFCPPFSSSLRLRVRVYRYEPGNFAKTAITVVTVAASFLSSLPALLSLFPIINSPLFTNILVFLSLFLSLSLSPSLFLSCSFLQRYHRNCYDTTLLWGLPQGGQSRTRAHHVSARDPISIRFVVSSAHTAAVGVGSSGFKRAERGRHADSSFRLFQFY